MPAELTGDLQTLLMGAAVAPLNDRAFLHISGSDATRWLNGMVTNSIQALQPGEGNYNFILNAQGRIQGDCTIYRDAQTAETAYLLETDSTQIETIQQLLDRFIIMDDVELTPAMSGQTGFLLLGPGAVDLVSSLQANVGAPFRIVQFPSVAGTKRTVLTRHPGLVPQFELFGEDQFELLGATEISPIALEQLRVLEARPRYGTDIRERDLPQETNQPQALHFAKGCYVGQEIVERIRSRGQVHRLLTPFRLEGTLPTSGPTPLEANGKPAGELTSVTEVQTTEGPVALALGYARREFLEGRIPLSYEGGIAHPRSPGSLV